MHINWGVHLRGGYSLEGFFSGGVNLQGGLSPAFSHLVENDRGRVSALPPSGATAHIISHRAIFLPHSAPLPTLRGH